MLRRIDLSREEGIRRWPVWFARLANRLIGWTDEACGSGCGRPITQRFNHTIERIGGSAVMVGLCSIDSPCEREVMRDPRDGKGRSYADIRPDIVQGVHDKPDTVQVRLTRVV